MLHLLSEWIILGQEDVTGGFGDFLLGVPAAFWAFASAIGVAVVTSQAQKYKALKDSEATSQSAWKTDFKEGRQVWIEDKQRWETREASLESKIEELQVDLDAMHDVIKELKVDLESCHAERASLKIEVDRIAAQVNRIDTELDNGTT